MNEEKIREVFSDEEFVKSLCAMKTPEEAQAALAEKGIDVTIDELLTCAKLAQKKAAGELTDEELQSVAGGSVIAGLFVAAIGLVGGVGFGFVATVFYDGAQRELHKKKA